MFPAGSKIRPASGSAPCALPFPKLNNIVSLSVAQATWEDISIATTTDTTASAALSICESIFVSIRFLSSAWTTSVRRSNQLPEGAPTCLNERQLWADTRHGSRCMDLRIPQLAKSGDSAHDLVEWSRPGSCFAH